MYSDSETLFCVLVIQVYEYLIKVSQRVKIWIAFIIYKNWNSNLSMIHTFWSIIFGVLNERMKPRVVVILVLISSLKVVAQFWLDFVKSGKTY